MLLILYSIIIKYYNDVSLKKLFLLYRRIKYCKHLNEKHVIRVAYGCLRLGLRDVKKAYTK